MRVERFPNDEAAEKWFEAQRWPDGRHCPDCGSTNTATVPNRRPMPYRCWDCRSHFSVRKGTVMQSSKIGLQKWVIAMYMMMTGLKGSSSMTIYRALGIQQKTAWYLMQRIREGFLGDTEPMTGPAEVDETCFGGRRKNMHAKKRRELKGRGPVGKAVVVGARDRATKRVAAKKVEGTGGETLRSFVEDTVAPDATVYTDDAGAYRDLTNPHGRFAAALASTSVTWRTRTGSRVSGRRRNGPTRARSTTSARSTYSVTCRSSRGATTFATWTRSSRCVCSHAG